ncbi:MAG: glycosyltransferase family 2 protein [Eubacteriales bacterium]|nr:glycosyltransferase family 2 protein [Eubacteriales bacterium]
MSELIFNIDINWYELNNEDSFFIEGWMIDNAGSIELEVSAREGEILPSSVQWKERTDIYQARPELPKQELPGFCLQIPNITKKLETMDQIDIWAYANDEKHRVASFGKKEIQTRIADCSIDYRVDILQFLGTELELQGWFVDQAGKNEIELLDEKNRPITGKINRISRRDVQDQYSQYLDPGVFAGFVIKVQKKDIQGRYVRVCFVSHHARKEYRVDMRRMQRNLTQSGRFLNVFGPDQFKKNRTYIKEHGFAEFKKFVKEEIYLGMAPYTEWVKKQVPSKEEQKIQKQTNFKETPKISIVIPLYQTPKKYLKIIVDSIVEQTYSNWELCLADGSPDDSLGTYLKKTYRKENRIRYQHLTENKGISGNTNAALAMATGEYIMLSDHDDIVEQGTLFEIVKAVNEKHPDILYTDEDKVSMDGKSYFEPNFKTDFNPFMLESNNYICHIFVVKKQIIDKIGGFRPEFDGAQDFDLILRCWEESDDQSICHIPKMLYHWRSHPNSTATNPESKRYAYVAGAKALEEHFKRIGVEATAEITQNLGFYRIHRKILGEPMVSIIIPNKDHIDDLQTCVSSIVEKSTYQNYEILIVENNSEDSKTFKYYETLQTKYKKCRVIRWDGIFNYAAINNFAAEQAAGKYLLFLNNDTEIISENWIEEMLGICQLPQVGAVGAKLYYEDKTLQHAGVTIGMGGLAGHLLQGTFGYIGRSTMPQNLSAVTAACMMTSREDFSRVNGFSEEFVVAYNDIDFCMKLLAEKLQIVFTPYAELFHYESKSRGLEDTKEKQERLAGEAAIFKERWPQILKNGDPYYNKNLSLKDGNCRIREEDENI